MVGGLDSRGVCSNSTSNVPGDGRMRPKHVELSITYLLHGAESFLRS